MKIDKENIEYISDAIANIVGAQHCLRAISPSEAFDAEGEGYHEEVEISISAPDGDGSFRLPIPSEELETLHEAIFAIECSMRYNLSKSMGIDFD